MWLALAPDLLVVGECAGGPDVCPTVRRLRPDVVLMDLDMPGRAGFLLAERLHAAAPSVPVVVLSLHDDAGTRARVQASGASAFVCKHDGQPRLLAAIRSVARTGTGCHP